MIIQCSSCLTRYHYDETRFAGLPVKKIRCTKCQTVFEIHNPEMPGVPEGFQPDETGPLNSPVLRADDFSLDPTVMGGPRRRAGVGPLPPPLPASLVAAQTMRAGPSEPRAQPSPGAASVPSTGESPRLGANAGEDRPLRLPEWYRLSLACIAGPDSGRIFEIDQPRAVIGRANSDVLLTDSQCSRQHAAIEVSDDHAWIVDLGSTNGTFVGEKRINRHELDNRSEFDVGATTLMFIRTRKD